MRVQLVVSADDGNASLSFTVTDEDEDGRRSLQVNEVQLGTTDVLRRRAGELFSRLLDALDPEEF